MNALTLRFSLFGIPTTIYPMTWLILALLGGAFRIQGGEDIIPVLLFVVAGLIAILCHEYGHATTSRRLAGAYPEVVISGFSGYATHPGGQFTRWTYFATVLAGPVAGLIPGAIALMLLGLQTGVGMEAIQYAYNTTISLFVTPDNETQMQMQHFIEYAIAGEPAMNPRLLMFYHDLFFVSFIWTAFNLLPLYPLDGGKLLAGLLNSEYKSAIVGVVVSIPFCIWALQTGSILTILIVGYIAYMNYQHYTMLRSMRG